VQVDARRDVDKGAEELLSSQLQMHVLGPLIKSYEHTIATLEKELEKTKFMFK